MKNNNLADLKQAHEDHFKEQIEDYRFGFFPNQAQFNIRNNRVSKVIVSAFKTIKSGVIVDLGCNVGYFGPVLKSLSTNTIGIDISFNALRRCKKLHRYETLVSGSFQHLPFATDSISGILLLDCLSIYNAIETQQILSEAHRVLRPGGILIFENNATSMKSIELLRFLALLLKRVIARKKITLAVILKIYFNFHQSLWSGISIEYPSRRLVFQSLKTAGFIRPRVYDKKYMKIIPRQRILLTCKKSP